MFYLNSILVGTLKLPILTIRMLLRPLPLSAELRESWIHPVHNP